mmetsp:Transcript_25411/g.79176  ORF Transcript_25411/g.79176 Transcript_25411/m.79176 type:complete len:383 (-) Transcript_25411:53-1201(-)
MGLHAHVLPGSIVVHKHGDPTGPHAHEGEELGAPADENVDGRWHEHVLHMGEERGLRVRHRHANADAKHDHSESALVAAPGDLLLVPLRPQGWRVLFPAWQKEHPWWDLWPIHEITFTHAKAHFSSSGVNDAWPGALTVVTQGFKLIFGILAWFWGRGDDSAAFYNASLWAMLGVSAALTACWLSFWRRSPISVALTLANYALYVNGWALSVLTLYDQLEAKYKIDARLALLPVLGPPAYITLRTVLFFPSAARRTRFLLAALSNRSVPLDMNLHVVGPPNTRKSHGFLVMLNSYAMVVTMGSKVVIFSLGAVTAGEVAAHVAHLLSTVWASLFAIRCRQLALDCYEGTAAEAASRAAAPAAPIGKADAEPTGGCSPAAVEG